MLQVLIFAVYASMLYGIATLFKSKLIKSQNKREACIVRKEWLCMKYFSIIILIAMNLLVCYLLCYFENGGNIYWPPIIQSTVVTTILGFFGMDMSQNYIVFNPVSFVTIERFRKKMRKPFAIYLRGFDTDNYSNLSDVKLRNNLEFKLKKTL